MTEFLDELVDAESCRRRSIAVEPGEARRDEQEPHATPSSERNPALIVSIMSAIA